MAVSKKPESKVVIKMAGGTFLDVKIVHTHEGHGRERRVKKSEYAIFHSKTRVIKNGFNKSELALDYIIKNFDKYDKKTKKFNL
jgi:hypothetical protein